MFNLSLNVFLIYRQFHKWQCTLDCFCSTQLLSTVFGRPFRTDTVWLLCMFLRLVNETLEYETETRPRHLVFSPRRDLLIIFRDRDKTETRPRHYKNTSRDCLETETSRSRLHPWAVCPFWYQPTASKHWRPAFYITVWITCLLFSMVKRCSNNVWLDCVLLSVAVK